jgi:hypothetical protein
VAAGAGVGARAGLLLDVLLREHALAAAARLIGAGALVFFLLELQRQREVSVFLFVVRGQWWLHRGALTGGMGVGAAAATLDRCPPVVASVVARVSRATG